MFCFVLSAMNLATLPSFLLSFAVSIRPRMRDMLVDWLVEVHLQFNLLQETLYLTVSTLDRFLQARGASVTTRQLQLVGVTAMFVACKYEEMYPPEIGDFVYITDGAYTEAQIRRMEVAVMAALDFDLGRPLPINFLRRDSKAANVEMGVHSLAKYAMELALADYGMAHLPPSVVAGKHTFTNGVNGVKGKWEFNGVKGNYAFNRVKGNYAFNGVKGNYAFNGVKGNYAFNGIKGNYAFNGVKGK